MSQHQPDLNIKSLESDLQELSRNLWWSWTPQARSLWERLAARLPGSGRAGLSRNPVRLLQSLRPSHLRACFEDPEMLRLHKDVMQSFREYLRNRKALGGFSPKRPVAYFSMEFGVDASLPIYAGGLGILAGDHLKSSSDISLPLVGVGLFYHRGYFRQELDGQGRQRVRYPRTTVEHLPLEAVRRPSGRELRISVELPDGKVELRVWHVRVGHVSLYLLDSDLPENSRAHRGITQKLYGGSREDRIRQEVIAGIGGVRALRALGVDPGVWHLNEGHMAFLTLERIREVRKQLGLGIPEALEAVASSVVFTTHTPVPEGNEEFDLELASRYLAPHAQAAGMSVYDYLSLGLHRKDDGSPSLSMTVLALRLSRYRNGVSQLHGEVSRRMWADLWPGCREKEVPITAVTNGIHTPSWVSPSFDDLLQRYCGADWIRHLDDGPYWKSVRSIPNVELWKAKQALKNDMIGFLREREEKRLQSLGMAQRRRDPLISNLLDPDVLTIGFARRFALYKRAPLIFHDLKRARKLFASTSRPVQIIFAGKPHPEDQAGKLLFEEIAAFSRSREFRGRVVILENYDMELCRHLVHGVDVWLNNPRRPQEASGTSGQKVPINGGLNLSILDGWWCEGYSPATGWAFGDTREYESTAKQDTDDSRDLYRILEQQLLPLYYKRDRKGIPGGWLRKVKSSMAELIPAFSTSRMVGEYARRLYLPALEGGRAMVASRGQQARALARWREEVLRHWPFARVQKVARGANGSRYVDVFLPGVHPTCLHVTGLKGTPRQVRLARTLAPDVYRLEILGVGPSTKGSDSRRLELFPVHPLLTTPQELGVTLPVLV